MFFFNIPFTERKGSTELKTDKVCLSVQANQPRAFLF